MLDAFQVLQEFAQDLLGGDLVGLDKHTAHCHHQVQSGDQVGRVLDLVVELDYSTPAFILVFKMHFQNSQFLLHQLPEQEIVLGSE